MLSQATSDHLVENNPDLPILLLFDHGVFVPRNTLSRHIETGHPIELMQTVASTLVSANNDTQCDQPIL
jgi:hypothetical protein